MKRLHLLLNSCLLFVRLGRSIGTVKDHLFHAHRTLRHQLLPYFKFGL